MRITTYNIHEFVDAGGRPRINDAIALLREVDSDVLLLNEVGDDSARSPLYTLGEALRMHVTFGKAGWGGNALLTREAPRDVEHFKLNAEVEYRSAIVARVSLEGLELDAVCVHLDHYREDERVAQLACLERLLAHRPVHFLAGDLNAMRLTDFDEPGRVAMKALRERSGFERGRDDLVRALDASGYVDAVRLALAGSPEAYEAALGDPIPAEHAITSRVESRIDYIVLSRALAPLVRARAPRTVVSDVSDHNLVSVELVPA